MTKLALITLVSILSVLVSGAPTDRTLVHRAGGGKAGISWPQQEQSIAPVTKFFGPDSKLNWWFNWNKNYGTKLFPLDTAQVKVDAEFVPMEYDGKFLNNADPLDDGWKTLMGFNEPDMSAEAGVSTPADPIIAANDWKALVTKLRADNPAAELWSPAVAHDKAWLKTFFANICPGGVAGCEFAPKYLAVHVYATNLDNFKSQINAYHSEDFGNLPLVITEFACYIFDGTKPAITPDQASKFMRDVIPWLETTDWIHKYSWFGAVRNAAWLYEVPEANRLMDAAGNLTPLGKQYIAGGAL